MWHTSWRYSNSGSYGLLGNSLKHQRPHSSRLELSLKHSLNTVIAAHIKSRLSLIVRVNVVLNRIVFVDSDWRFDNLCGSNLHSQSELYHVSWWYCTLVIDLIGQLRRDVIVRLSVKPWCYWLWRLVISNWCVSIRLLSQLNSRLLLVKLSVL